MELTFLNVEVDLLAVLLAAVAAMAVGFLWYSQMLFGKKWMRLVNLDPQKAKEAWTAPMVVSFICALVTAFLIGVLVTYIGAFNDYSEIMASVVTGLVVWAFVALSMLMNYLYSRKSMNLWFIEVTHHLVSFVVMALVYVLVV